MSQRPPLPVALIAFLACSPAPEAPPSRTFTLLSANVGNLDLEPPYICPGEPYAGATCSVGQEQAIRANIDRLKPDLVVLLEVLDADRCKGVTSTDPDLACTGFERRVPYQQVRRYVGDGYAIACDGLAHFDCVAVRDGFASMRECPANGTCLGAAVTPPHPASCGESAWITSVSKVHLDVAGEPMVIVVHHPLNASKEQDDPCRRDQYVQAFETLPETPRTLVAGDFNFDPYRLATLWGTGPYFHSKVGEGLRFKAISVGELVDGFPVPSWLGLATLDYVVADFGEGTCAVLGQTAGTEAIDRPLATLDHNALSCTVSW